MSCRTLSIPRTEEADQQSPISTYRTDVDHLSPANTKRTEEDYLSPVSTSPTEDQQFLVSTSPTEDQQFLVSTSSTEEDQQLLVSTSRAEEEDHLSPIITTRIEEDHCLFTSRITRKFIRSVLILRKFSTSLRVRSFHSRNFINLTPHTHHLIVTIVKVNFTSCL